MLSILRREPDAFGADEIELAGTARAARRDRRPEHPRVRVRARDRRRAAAPLRAARRLRLARLARAAQPDGRRDRRRPDAPGALARADARAARVLPRADRDETSRLATLIGDVLDTSRIEAGTFSYRVHRRRRRRARARNGRRPPARPGRGRRGRPRPEAALPRVRGDRERLKQVLIEPDRERRQVLAGRRRGRRDRAGRRGRPGARRRRGLAARGSRASSTGLIFEKFGRANVGGGKPGIGPRPVHRALDRRGARRDAGRAVGARPGRDVHARAPAPD